ncbi:serine hydrolase [Alloiococcus sp. CFN-8]|uniref:serine hydrolase n=1 Tax=Alloiococcus sp. CFN-8 TaxID=3416081 RepID=UPI003CF91D2A
MKRIILLLLALIICTLSFTDLASASAEAPQVTAAGAALMDGETGELLYDKNANVKYPPASTTKIMTALVVLENTNINDKVTVGENPPYVDGSAVGIVTGETYTVKDLLIALMLASGNDCAEALAEHVGGTTEGFVKMMNERAKELGCKNTNFVNPSGLYDKNHYTTAKDLALILRELIKYDSFLEWEKLVYYEMPPTEKDPNPKWIGNKNALVLDYADSYYPYAIAGKTGYTVDSKHSYAAAANKDGRILISTMLYGENKSFYFPESKALLEYGYENFELIKLYEKNEEVTEVVLNDTTVPLLASSDVYTIVKADEAEELFNNKKFVADTASLGGTNFKAGDEILESSIYLDEELVATLALVSGSDYTVPAVKTVKDNVVSFFSSIKGFLLYGAAVILLLIIILFTIRFINLRRRRRIFRKRNRRRNKYHF